MATQSVPASVFKLALAGEQAGFTIEQMIEFLNAGITVETLFRIIEWKLTHAPVEASQLPSPAMGNVKSSAMAKLAAVLRNLEQERTRLTAQIGQIENALSVPGCTEKTVGKVEEDA
jgi:hypothetical protein